MTTPPPETLPPPKWQAGRRVALADGAGRIVRARRAAVGWPVAVYRVEVEGQEGAWRAFHDRDIHGYIDEGVANVQLEG